MVLSMIRKLLGKRREAWDALATSIGGERVEAPFFSLQHDRVTLRLGNWEILLDQEQDETPYRTRIRVAFLVANPDDEVSMFLTDRGVLDRAMSSVLGPDMKTGDERFDARFSLVSATPERIGPLFADDLIRDLCRAQPKLDLRIRQDYGLAKKRLPEGVHEIRFVESGSKIHDAHRLEQLFALFSRMLSRLAEVGVISREYPGIRLLSGPDGDRGELAWEVSDSPHWL